ncbi:MAG: dUTP diphosphatase [Chthonomonadaceae bacterium]|nr:dUTP diphosphatase [Chthonomonadaceae bacterium]
MEQVEVQIQILEGGVAPTLATEGSSGFDLRAAESLTLQPGSHRLIKTGLKIELPSGYEGQVRPRSGLALRHGLTVLNSPGTIDSDYRGEIGVILINFGPKAVEIVSGDRIAQLVVQSVPVVRMSIAGKLATTDRGDGGFGSTGID